MAGQWSGLLETVQLRKEPGRGLGFQFLMHASLIYTRSEKNGPRVRARTKILRKRRFWASCTSLAISRPFLHCLSHPRACRDRYSNASGLSALGIVGNGLLRVEKAKSTLKIFTRTGPTTSLWPFLAHSNAVCHIQGLSETDTQTRKLLVHLELSEMVI